MYLVSSSDQMRISKKGVQETVPVQADLFSNTAL